MSSSTVPASGSLEEREDRQRFPRRCRQGSWSDFGTSYLRVSLQDFSKGLPKGEFNKDKYIVTVFLIPSESVQVLNMYG